MSKQLESAEIGPEDVLLHQDQSGENRYCMILRREAAVSVVVIHGSMLRAVPKSVVSGIENILTEAPRGVLIDLSTCKYMCSSALSYLVRFHDRASNVQKKVVLVGAQQRVRDVLELLGLHRLFEVVHNLDEARSKLAS